MQINGLYLKSKCPHLFFFRENIEGFKKTKPGQPKLTDQIQIRSRLDLDFIYIQIRSRVDLDFQWWYDHGPYYKYTRTRENKCILADLDMKISTFYMNFCAFLQ